MQARVHRGEMTRALQREHRDGSASGRDRISAVPAVNVRRPGSSVPAGPRRPLTACALALLVGALAGCGSSHPPGTSADPASAVPASAQAYAGADVRPQGAEKSGALAAGRSLSHQANPYLRLLQALQTPGSPALDFGRDVAPWLGPHAGVYLSSLSSAGALLPLLQQGLLGSAPTAGAFPFGSSVAQGAIVLDTTDTAKARSFLEAQATRAGAHASSYRGVSYRATAAGVALGLVGRFAVIGSESGLRGVIDTIAGGPALLQAPGYAKLLAAAPTGALAHLYTNPTAQQASAQPGGAGILQLLGGAREANVSLLAAQGSLTVAADTHISAATGTPGGLLAASAEGAQAFGELPGDSWLAAGLGHLGSTLGQDIAGLGELTSLGSSLTGSSGASSSSTLNVKGLIEGLLAPLRVLGANTAQAKRDFTSWMGSGAIYASGSGLLELKGAVVIESLNPSASRAAVAKLAALLRSAGDGTQPASIAGTDAAVAVRVPGLPVVLAIANGPDAAGHTKFVLGLGEASVGNTLNPPSKLADAASRSAAATALGEGIQPSLIFEVPTLLSLLEGVGLSEDPTLAKVVPYLRSVSSVAGGGRTLGGEVERYKLVVGLR
jgi:hypothetical protein